MKKIITLVLSCCIGTCFHIHAQGPIIAAGVIVKVLIDNLQAAINQDIQEAMKNGNYILLNAANSANVLLQNADYMVGKHKDDAFRRLSIEEQRLFYKVQEILKAAKSMESTVVNIEDMVALDIQNFINQLPFKSDVFLLRRIDGFSIKYQEQGFYEVRLVGNAFTEQTTFRVFFEDSDSIGKMRELNTNYVITEPPYALVIRIPVGYVASKFSENEIKQVKIRVECRRLVNQRFRTRDRSVFEYEGKINLFPIYPATYELVENYTGLDYSDGPYTSEVFNATIPRTNHFTCDFKLDGFLKITVPSGVKIMPESLRRWAQPDERFVSWSQPVITDNAIIIRADHCIHDKETVLMGFVSYMKENPTAEEKNLLFQDTNSETRKLKFGKYFAPLDATYENYTLKLFLFTGAEITLTPSDPIDDRAKAIVESGTRFKRIVLTLN